MDQVLPQIRVFTSAGCSHCSALISLLVDRVKSGGLARLEITNLERNPGLAAELGIRSVPYTLIGELAFEGGLNAAELDHWIGMVGSDEAIRHYYIHLLARGQRSKVESDVIAFPNRIADLVDVLAHPDSTTDQRLGVAATLEELAEHPIAHHAIEPLAQLAESVDARVRADACHLLSLIPHASVRPILLKYRTDPDAEVREIIQEALENQ